MKITDDIVEKFAVQVARDGERWRDEMRAAMSQFANGLRLQGARPLAVPFSAGTKLLWGGPCRLLGWTLRNPAAAGGNIGVTLYDGRDNGAAVVGTASVGSGSAWAQSLAWFGPSGVSVGDALFLESVVGAGTPNLVGAVYIGAVD